MINSITHCPICLTELKEFGLKYRKCPIVSDHTYEVRSCIIDYNFKAIDHIIDYNDYINNYYLRIFYYQDGPIRTDFSTKYSIDKKWINNPVETFNIEFPISNTIYSPEFIQNLKIIS